jgi:hypothetical protein
VRLTTSRGLLAGLSGAVLLLGGCAQQPVARVSSTRLFATDQMGAAKSCTASQVSVTPGQEAPATMTVGNDGGWCALTVDNAGRPFSAGLLPQRPHHGRVFIHSVGDATRIDYTPERGYAGPDSFAVRLLPGEGIVRVAVTVTAPGAAPARPPHP